MSFFLEGRLIVIERFEDESDASFAERSSFILCFRNDPINYNTAVMLSFHHVSKMFSGTTYKDDIEKLLVQYREEANRIRKEVNKL